MNAQTSTLDDRIADALTRRASPDELLTLISEAKIASDRATNLYSAARIEALDPATPKAKVAAARQSMSDAEFAAERLKAAVIALEERHRQEVERLAEERAQAEHDAALNERDALAKEIATVYPQLAGKLADLLRRLKASNERISGKGLRSAEAIARNAPENWEATPASYAPPLLHTIRLPQFDLRDRGNFGLMFPTGMR